jgi:hypothetical protein
VSERLCARANGSLVAMASEADYRRPELASGKNTSNRAREPDSNRPAGRALPAITRQFSAASRTQHHPSAGRAACLPAAAAPAPLPGRARRARGCLVSLALRRLAHLTASAPGRSSSPATSRRYNAPSPAKLPPSSSTPPPPLSLPWRAAPPAVLQRPPAALSLSS